MKNNLTDLNNYLFEEIERLNDDETLKNEEDFNKEIKRAKTISCLAQQVVGIANSEINAIKTLNEYGIEKEDIPDMLKIGLKK